MCASFVTLREPWNYLLFQPHLHRLPLKEGEFLTLGETEGRVSQEGEALKKTCLCLNYLADSLLQFHRSLDFFQNRCLAKGVGRVQALWRIGYSFLAAGYGRVQHQEDPWVQNGGGKSEMVSVWPADIFSKLKWLWGLVPAPHNTGRLCLILGA